MSRKSDLVSIVTFVSILGVTGIVLFIWMSSQSWVDKTGVIVGIIFLALTALQSGLSILWWCVAGRKNNAYTIGQNPQEIELKPAVT
ncbi:hypothetical protein LSH36_6g04007 [Paralvinella palmiformis]|uniref:Uncharacterized protein n=1 Tax=Paralvinella palmiformis TaxID=53620 RepID=A0AAD9NH52_9ANNE|nr:hypothetical protein LSH36_6g04007 [Paralvinella palmiformis]